MQVANCRLRLLQVATGVARLLGRFRPCPASLAGVLDTSPSNTTPLRPHPPTLLPAHTPISNMHWSDTLEDAVKRFDGGDASFPTVCVPRIASQLGYEFPNKDYDKLFFQRHYTPDSSAEQLFVRRPRSAGWVIPHQESRLVCKPVFVAHSNLGAIWLLRETLGHDAVPDSTWSGLVDAALVLSAGPSPGAAGLRGDQGFEEDEYGSDIEQVPPSGQMPPHGSSASNKRAGCALLEPTRKRARTGEELSDDGGVKEAEEQTEGAEEGADGEEEGAEHAVDVEEEGEEDGATEEVADEATERTDDADEAEGRVTTVSNNNRRHELKLKKKLDVSRAKKRLELGLMEPGEKAPLRERAAYSSIPAKDESTIAWIIKQKLSAEADFYSASPTPYFTAVSVLEKARALGNQSSKFCAAQFLHTWREQGTPFRAGTEERQLVQASQLPMSYGGNLSQGGRADSAFCFAWGMCKRYETALAAVHIGSRWAFALLGEAYAQKIQQIRQEDFVASNDRSRNRYGKGQVRTEAIAALIKLVYKAPMKRDHEVFRNRLKQAMRWHTIVKGLGWGSLLLIPPEEVSNWWVERVLRVGQLEVFVSVVKRERPDLCAASKALETWLGPEGIAGGSISSKQMLSIEAEAPPTIYEVEEVEDSEEEEMLDTIESADNESSHDDNTGPKRFRQMTLTELFHPFSAVK